MAVAVEEQGWPLALWGVLALTIGGAGLLIVACLTAGTWGTAEVAVVAGLALAGAAASQFQLELPYPTEDSSYDVLDVLWIGALLLVAPELLLVAVAAGVLLGQAVRGWDTVKVLFNAAQHTLAVGAAAAVYLSLGAPPVTRPTAWLVAGLASAAYHVVNALAIGVVIALSERTSLRRATVAGVSLLQVCGNAALGALGAVLWVDEPLALVLLVPPLVLVYLAYRGWVRSLQERDAMREMARTADQVARGADRSTRLPQPPFHDDAAVLATTLNRMLDRLDGSLQRERRFIRETSHELRTPITIVRGHLEVLGPRPAPAELAETTELVLDELDRMARLVEDMSLLARSEDPATLRLSDLPVARLVASVQARATALLDRPLEVPHPVPAGAVCADEQRLTQALINLIGNAGTHTPPGTPVSLAVVTQAGHWRFEVRDTGSGLPPGMQDTAFEPFRTGGTATAGSGLGLAIVAGIAKAHGGSAGVDNRPGEGATFWLHVPR